MAQTGANGTAVFELLVSCAEITTDRTANYAGKIAISVKSAFLSADESDVAWVSSLLSVPHCFLHTVKKMAWKRQDMQEKKN